MRVRKSRRERGHELRAACRSSSRSWSDSRRVADELAGANADLKAAAHSLTVRARERACGFKEKLALMGDAQESCQTPSGAVGASAADTTGRSSSRHPDARQIPEGAEGELRESASGDRELVAPVRQTMEKLDGRIQGNQRRRAKAPTRR